MQSDDQRTNDLLNIIEARAPKPKEKFRANSNFHIVLNTNISHYDLKQKTPEYRLELIRDMRKFTEHFKNSISEYTKINKPNLIDFSANMEIGGEKKFLHIDGMLRFDGYCLLDTGKITRYFNSTMAKYTKGCYFHVQYVHDNIASAQSYSLKDQAPLI